MKSLQFEEEKEIERLFVCFAGKIGRKPNDRSVGARYVGHSSTMQTFPGAISS